MSATIRFDVADTIGAVPPRLYGVFVEHMGRSVHGGIHDPADPSADERGFRTDVLALARELGATVVRYPGGNFVSGYRWEDGVGPVDERPVRLEVAWRGIEPNTVGLHEFADWAQDAGLEIVEAVNLGTRGPAEAAELLEYANHPAGTELSDRRRANGREEPFAIRTWCLGNEMDGPWQIGHKTAEEYGRIAAETARLMRFIDPGLELVAAGSSSHDMATFGAWERTVLRLTDGLVDHLSVHAYVEEEGDLTSFLASGAALDRYLDDVIAILDEVGATGPGGRPVGISVDEWNVWSTTRWNEVDKHAVLGGEWRIQPVIEDEYTVVDGVVVGGLLIALLRHVDRVSMANLAQLVNVIAPIRCEPGLPAWRQPTYFPFQAASALARGTALRPTVEAGSIQTARYGAVDRVDAVATVDDEGVTVLLINRDAERALPVAVEIAGASLALSSARVLAAPEGGGIRSTNGPGSEPVHLVDLPGATAERDASGTALPLELPALSWAIVRLVTEAPV